MGVTLKIADDFYEDTFTLIALHSSLEDYLLAYKLNENLRASFKRCPQDLDISQEISFPIFEWKDITADAYWTLITNYSLKETHISKPDLFQDIPSFTSHYLLPEFKDVDYFLKIEQENTGLPKKILDAIITMPEIVTAYLIETHTIKSINNLIY